MISKYGIFCSVVELENFTRAAERSGYSQSAISQAVKSLERELGFTLLDRRKDGICLTADGQQFYPYIKSVWAAEQELAQKQTEMQGFQHSIIRLGTFTSVSRTLLPPLMKQFQDAHPGVSFVLRQGEYTSITDWIEAGSVDFGFLNRDCAAGIETRPLYRDAVVAVLPPGHPLAEKPQLRLEDLLHDPLILLDEGAYNVTRAAFQAKALSPHIAYEVYDDYTILSMIRQHMGIALMYRQVLDGFSEDLVVRPLEEAPCRTIALAWRNYETLPSAARHFIAYLERAIRSSAPPWCMPISN